jgi:hypothetical protein
VGSDVVSMQQPRHVKATDYVGQTSRRYRSPRTVPLALAPPTLSVNVQDHLRKTIYCGFSG